MSTCISQHGEYSSHTPENGTFVCGRCGVEDWPAAMAEIQRLTAVISEHTAESDLSCSITTVENTNFGDHAERLPRAHEYVPGETVESLVRRVFPKLAGKWQQHDATDVIEIRVVTDRFGNVTGEIETDPTESPF